MLSKALKQDIMAFLPLWLFLSAVAFCSSFTIGGGINLISSESIGWANVIGVLLIVFSFMVIAGYFFATVILIGVRFYRNFYTDEGYLTFTLPVRRSTLYFSKVLSGVIFLFSTTLVILLSVSIGLMLVPVNENTSAFGFVVRYLWDALRMMIVELQGDFSTALIFLLGALILFSILVYEILIMYLCITVGSVIAKKHKVLLSIACYYGLNAILSTVSSIAQVVFVIFSPFIALAIASCATVSSVVWANLILLGVLAFMIVVLCIVYYETRKLIENKLNLP